MEKQINNNFFLMIYVKQNADQACEFLPRAPADTAIASGYHSNMNLISEVSHSIFFLTKVMDEMEAAELSLHNPLCLYLRT